MFSMIGLSFGDSSNWKDAAWNLLRQVSLIQHNACDTHPSCCKGWQLVPLLLLRNVLLYKHIKFFLHSPVEGHLGCFQYSVIINRVAINVVYRLQCEPEFHFSRVDTKETAGTYGQCMINFRRNSQMFSRMAAPFCSCANNRKVPVAPHPWQTRYCQYFSLELFY